MNPTKNDIPEGTRERICKLLNDRLAESIDLGLRTKQAHWNVKGPQFIALHELFDATYSDVQEWVDTIAERIVQLGGIAEGTLAQVSGRSKMPIYPGSIQSAPEHLTALVQSLALFGGQIRTAIDVADEAKDKGTADLFTEVSRAADKRLWFLEAHLQNH